MVMGDASALSGAAGTSETIGFDSVSATGAFAGGFVGTGSTLTAATDIFTGSSDAAFDLATGSTSFAGTIAGAFGAVGRFDGVARTCPSAAGAIVAGATASTAPSRSAG